jgi:hypothetical protein
MRRQIPPHVTRQNPRRTKLAPRLNYRGRCLAICPSGASEGLIVDRPKSSAASPPAKSSHPTADHYADDKRNCQSLERCALGPLSQSVQWRAGLAARVDRVGHRLSRRPHGFSSRLDSFLRALELRCTIRILKRFAFADHLESPSQHAGYHRQRVDSGAGTSFQTHWRWSATLKLAGWVRS